MQPIRYVGPSGTSPLDPSYSYGSVYELPNQNPLAVPGAIPTPPADYGPTRSELPHDYYNAVDMLRQTGQYTPEMDQWLQAAYALNKRRT